MVIITEAPISPESVIGRAGTRQSGCVVTYVGLIRETSQGKSVLSVEYRDFGGKAEGRLSRVADEAKQNWSVNRIVICHRIGKLEVGDINLVVAVASAHRREGFAACKYVIDQFKERLPTVRKRLIATAPPVLIVSKELGGAISSG